MTKNAGALNTKTIACSDCRFKGGTFNCYHDKALSYDVEGEETWNWRSRMRERDGACGPEARLFENLKPMELSEKLWGWFWVFLLCSAVVGCCIAIQPK